MTLNVATANGDADAPGDYTAIPLTLKTFGAGVSSMAVNVAVASAERNEDRETCTPRAWESASRVAVAGHGTPPGADVAR